MDHPEPLAWSQIATALGIEASDETHLAMLIEERWVEASATMNREEAERLREAYALLEFRDLGRCRPTAFDAIPGSGVCRCLNPDSPVVCDDCPDEEAARGR